MKRLAILGLGLTVAACGGTKAPGGEGVCWLKSDTGGFAQIDADIGNVETCAARLEDVWLKTTKPVTGAYGGHLLFVDAQNIQFDLNGEKVRLLDARQRQSIDRLIEQGEKPIVDQP